MTFMELFFQGQIEDPEHELDNYLMYYYTSTKPLPSLREWLGMGIDDYIMLIERERSRDQS